MWGGNCKGVGGDRGRRYGGNGKGVGGDSI